MKNPTEIRNNYTDDENFTHIDCYFTDDDNEAGKTVAIVCQDSGKVFFTDNLYRNNPEVLEAIAEVTPKQKGQTYWLGSMKVIVHNIDEAKRWVTEIQEAVDESGMEISNSITDFFFEIEAAYQAYHGLDEDEWRMVEEIEHDN